MKRLLIGVTAALALACGAAWAEWQYVDEDDLVEGWVESSDYRLEVGCYDFWNDEPDFDEVWLRTPRQGTPTEMDRLKTRSPVLRIRIDGHEWSRAATVELSSDTRISFYADTNGDLYDRLMATYRPIEVAVTLSSPSEVFVTHSFTADGAADVLDKVLDECDW